LPVKVGQYRQHAAQVAFYVRQSWAIPPACSALLATSVIVGKRLTAYTLMLPFPFLKAAAE